jgi:arylsulfatase A-like enzyme
MQPTCERSPATGRASVLGLAIAGLLAWVACGRGDVPAPDASLPPHVLLVTLDTTRADHLSLYGHDRPTSPNLDELARESVVYERAYSTSSWTLPAHASLFTGRYPTSHGARHDAGGRLVLASAIERAPTSVRARAMDAGEQTLAELLAARGYRTGAVVAGPWLIGTFGLAKGFAHWDDDGIRSAAGRRATAVTDRAIAWLEAGDARPDFLFLNYFDPHAPYLPPPSHARAFLPPGVTPDPRSRVQADALYDAEILYMDHELGRLLRHLRESGRLDETLVVVTADHGELLGEHGTFGHGRFLWEPLTRVPLVVRPPGPRRAGRRESERVSLVDVAPLVLRAAGVPMPDRMQGAAPGERRDAVLAEVHSSSDGAGSVEAGVTWRARWDGSEKLLASDDGERRLYDLDRDPDERHDLAAARPDDMARAAHALEQAFAALPRPGPATPVEIDPGTLEALRAMGYVDEDLEEAGGGHH